MLDKTIEIIKKFLYVFDILFCDSGKLRHIDRISTIEDIFYNQFIGL